MIITDHDLTEEQLITMAIEVSKFGDIRMTREQAREVINTLTFDQKLRIIRSYKNILKM